MILSLMINELNILINEKISYLTWGRCNKKESSYTWIDEDIKHSTDLAVKYICF